MRAMRNAGVSEFQKPNQGIEKREKEMLCYNLLGKRSIRTQHRCVVCSCQS